MEQEILEIVWDLDSEGCVEGDAERLGGHECLRTAQDVIDVSRDKLYEKHWKDVDLIWRKTYAIGALVQIACHLKLGQYRDALRINDNALLMGVPIYNDILSRAAGYLQASIHSAEKQSASKHCLQDDGDELNPKRKLEDKEEPWFDCDELLCDGRWRKGLQTAIDEDIVRLIVALETSDTCPPTSIRRVENPSLQYFKDVIMKEAEPVVITQGMTLWPALQRWKSPAYFEKVAGLRTVPVEVGGQYTRQDWGQQMMTLNDFIHSHVIAPSPSQPASNSSPPSPKAKNEHSFAYLAQHELFDQIPELLGDISTPDYCVLSMKNDDEKEDIDEDDVDVDVEIKAWFGPVNTVSPCHKDPYPNLLCQAIGYKYIRLFNNKYEANLYPHQDILLNNTSRVDVGNPDTSVFINYPSTPYVETILRPGDMLYLPPTYWHYVRSLTVSFSVSFWWK